MGLSKDLIQQFVDVTNDIQDRNRETFVLATAVVSDGKTYVKIDGSEILTPVKSTTKLNEGDRVTVMIKNHTATVTGNITSPAVDSGEVEKKIDEFGTIIADNIEAQNAKIDNIVAENVEIKETLTATNAKIETIEAENVEINGKLEANEAEIAKLKVGKLDADTAEITYATIESLKATNIEVSNIKGEFADFSQLTAEDLKALNASIKNLETEKLNVKDAEIKFANIDFSNIGMAAIEELFAQSGIIKDLVTESGTITGELVGVTIKGDLIEAETLVADKLVVKGQDGLYYKLNVSGNTVESEQTEYNSLNGSIITAKSITATKISVSDLVAFDATIGGFKITDTSIYSGVKESATNGTRGIYLDSTGQLSVGDANNFIKFFKDTDGKWKLAISANTIKLSASNSDLESTIDDIKNKVQNTTKSIEEQFAASDNPTTVPTTGWSTTPPVWQNGKYIWSKTVTTYTDGRTVESKPVCITGAKGENGSSGSSGKGIKSITNYYLATNVNTGVTDATSGWTETVQTITASNKYLWNYEKVTYTDNSSTKTIPVIIGAYGDKGQTGSSGSNGQDGVGIKSIAEKYAVSSSNTTAPSTWHDTVQTMTATNKYLWNYEIVTYTNNTTSETSKRVIGVYGDKGATGATGATGKGIKSVTNYYLATNVNSGVTDTTSGWTTTIQSLTSTNKYLWNYELITYTDNSTTKTTPLVIGVYGDKGQNGATGATGNGIKSITEKYAVSTSNTTAPTTWFNEVQVMTATNKYLWNYEIITYTNGGTSETSKRVIGVYGDKGATGATGPAGAAGVGIKSVDVEYYLSTSSTSQAGGSWSTTAPTWVDGKYIWTRTKTVTTDNKTTTTSPVCITGGKGSTGSVGQGVESITEEYYLSTSKTTQTGGSWVTTPPTWSTGKYMWTRSKIVYKNPTSTAYTKPVCDSSWEAVNEIEVGGTNIALETNQGITGWRWSLSSGKATLTEAIENGIRCCKMVRDSTAVSSWSYISYSADRISREKYLPNKQYTVSFEVKASVVTGFNVVLQTGGSLYPFTDVARTKNTVANSWVKLYATITTKSTLPTNTGQVLYFSGMNSSPGVSYIFRNLKIEEGNKPTAWTPAPEDLDSKINTTNETVATIESNLNKITLRVSDTETKTATLEKKTEKMLINNFSRSGTKDGWSSNIGTITASNAVGYYANVSTNGNAQVTSEKFEIDVNKSYKMSLMVQNPSENATGSWFFGVYAYDKDNNNIGVYLGTGTSLDTNAYFHHEQKANKNTNWRTFEAYIYSHNTVVNANTPKGNCLTFMKFNPKTKYLVVRFLNYRSAPYGNGQTGSIYFAHPTISVVDNIIVDTEKRLKSAESKITSDAIVDTVKKHQTNGKNTFALTSQVTQTVDSWVAKFTSGGGYNLLKNSDAKNGQYMWTGNGVTLTIGTSGANPFFGGNEFKSTFPNGLKYSESIKLKANTDYVYEGWIHCDMSFKGSSVSPLHYWCMNTPNTSGQAQLEVLDYRQDVTANVFNKCYVHFRTKSGDVYFTPFVYGGPEGEMVAVRQLSLTEGKVETAWTPHPSEIYEGSTVIDASGVTVNNGALRVKDGSGNIMLEGDSTGSLYLRKRLNVGNTARIDATSGIEVVGGKLVISPANFDKTSEQIVLHETGVFFGYNVFGVGSFDCMVGFNSQDVAHGKTAGVFRFKGNTLGYEFDNFISAPSFRATTGGYMLKANQSIAWECDGDESRIFTESSDNVTKLVLQTGDDGAQDCVQIRSKHWSEGVSTIAQFDRDNVWLYKDCRTDRVAGIGSKYRVYVGEGNSRIDATADCYCRLYTAQWSNGAADTGLYLSPYGGVAVKVGGVSKHDLMANGNKIGGSIEIEGMTYGMSPIDSPRSMIEDIYFDYELSEGLNTIEINDILAKSLDKYAIFPSSNLVEVVEKTKYYFVVKADKACISDIRITGTRIDVKNQYYEIMGGITHGSEERVSY